MTQQPAMPLPVEALERRARKLATLLGVGRALSKELSLDSLLKLITTRASEVLDCDRCILFLLDRDRDELWCRASDDLKSGVIRLPVSEGIEGYVARTGEVVNTAEACSDPRFSPALDGQTEYRTRELLCVPVREPDGDVAGVLEVLNSREGPFTAEDEEFLGILAAQAAVALRNARLFEQLAALKDYNESILQSMSTAVVTIGPREDVETMNPASHRVFGLPDGVVWKGAPADRLLNAPANATLRAAVSAVRASGREYTGYDLAFEQPAGALVRLNVRVLPFGDTGGRAAGTVLIADELSDEQRLIGVLGRYMERQVIERLLAEGDHNFPRTARQRVAVLFSDIRSYTLISERASAEGIVAMLNDYFSRMGAQIYKHEGMLDKFIGDAIMAVFGAPVAREDDALQAVRAAMAMRRELWRYNEERASSGQPPIEIGIGVCAGDAVVGNIGSGDRLDYTVVGDVVNLASRLEGMTKDYACKILFNRPVYESVKAHVPCVGLGVCEVRGREEPVEIFGIRDDDIDREWGIGTRE